MFAWTSHGTELKRFSRQPITRAAIAVMLLIPLLYGAMYVWAFWDPTTRMDDLSVALVNTDRAATGADGAIVHYGQDVVDELTEDASLGWATVDEATARAGLDSGRYYFAVTIPADFSSSILSLGEEQPRPASIEVTYDDSNSFLASTLGRSAMLEVQTAVREKIGKQAVDTLLVGVGEARDGFAEASDGAFQLREGLARAEDGTGRLNVGARELAEGAARLAAGTGDLKAGATTLHDKLGDYLAGVTSAGAGAQQLRAGADGLTTLQQGLALAADDTTGAPALAAGIDRLAAGVTRLATGATGYATGAEDFASGAGTWVAGARQWQQGVASATGGRLVTGTDDLASGAGRLAAGTAPGSALADGAGSVAAGNAQLAAGLDQIDAAVARAQQALADGDTASAAETLAGVRTKVQGAGANASGLAGGGRQVSAGIAGLHTGATQLADGARALQAGWAEVHGAVTGEIAAGVGSLDTGRQELAAAAGELTAGAAQLADPATIAQVQQLDDGAGSLATALRKLSAGASDATAGIPALQSGLTELVAGFTDPEQGLVSGAAALHSGAGDLLVGIRQAGAGATKVSAGSSELAASTPELDTGLADAASGAGELGERLADGTEAIPDDNPAVRADRAQAIATPANLAAGHVHRADSWGEGFAPFFISLALWVGALITWLLLRPLQTRALMTSVNGFRMAWGSLNPALLLSLGQVVVMLSVMHFAVGLNPKNVLATLAFTLLAGAAFFALQQFFQVTLGSAVGKVVIIVLLMVQLASAGGTYPIQTTPAFLQVISPFMPMTYVVTGLREAITGGIEARFWFSVAVLAAIFVVSLAATSIASARKRMWTMSRLHPALSI